MTIRVLVVDDQSMVRAGFRLLLADEPDIEVVAEASNGLEAVAEAARFHPHVVLMDIRMPELDGLEATRRILAADPSSADPDPDHLRPRRVRLPSAAGRRERLRAQGRPARAADRRRPHGRRRRRPALARRHPTGDPAVHPAPPAGSAEGRGDPDRARDGRVPPDHARSAPTPRSGTSCSSATPRSRRTSPGCCRSSTCATARRRSCSPTRPGLFDTWPRSETLDRRLRHPSAGLTAALLLAEDPHGALVAHRSDLRRRADPLAVPSVET